MLKGVGIGAGYFAQFHYEAWHRLEGVNFVALCDLNLDKAKKMADRNHISKVYKHLEDMLDREQPDFLDIITPPDTHLELVKIAAGRKIHVICQKPLAPTLAEAEEIVAITEQAGIRFMVHENFRFQPWFRKTKALMDSGKIGNKIHFLHFKVRTGDGWPEDAYLNRQPYFRTMPRLFIYETGIHYVDTFRFLLGEIDQVYAKLRRFNANIIGEDAAWVNFDFKNGANALLDANRYNESTAEDPRYTFGEMLLETNTGSLRLYHGGRLTWQALGEREEEVPYTHHKRNFAGDCVYFTQEHFLTALAQGRPFETEGRDYLNNLIWQEAIYQSNATNQPVTL